MLKKIIQQISPPFLKGTNIYKEEQELFNYRNLWIGVILLISFVSILPLLILTFLNLNIYEKYIQAEIEYPLVRLISNTQKSINFFITQKKSALKFIVLNTPYEEIKKTSVLGKIYLDLKTSFGNIVDLGIIDSQGIQINYVGPYELKGKNYKQQDWYKEVLIKEEYISDVFLGYRNTPHFTISIKQNISNGDFFILRTTIDTSQLINLLGSLELDENSDAFILNQNNVFQTPSKFFGDVLEIFSPQNIKCIPDSKICEFSDSTGKTWIFGKEKIKGTHFSFVLVKKPTILKSGLSILKKETLATLVLGIAIVLVVVVIISTKLVTKIYYADLRRAALIHKVEHTNKLASIGRLAAGVAHEINNPLAIINETAGLIKDIFTFSDQYKEDKKLLSLIDSILKQVDRCRTITHRLLGFARHIDVKIEEVDLQTLLEEVLSFLEKEAQYRDIHVNITKTQEIPLIQSDRSKLQQIFLNIINNAFAAVKKGGHIDITLDYLKEKDMVKVAIKDDGIGISPENLKKIFDHFFSTKKDQGGTGLGLSITYGLVKKLKGEIQVESQVGKGTTFFIFLPVKAKEA